LARRVRAHGRRSALAVGGRDALGGVHRVADIWYVAEAGHVTVIVSLVEGP
jgi:hypothetical protein